MSVYQDKYNIICLSNQLWDFPNPTNKKHVMSRLSKLGHTVLFVDPPINFGEVFFRQLKLGLWSISRILTFTKKDLGTGVTVFTPVNFLPFSFVTSVFHIVKIRYLARKLFKLNSERKTILWVYHVQNQKLRRYLNLLKHDILIYDCVDNYSGFPEQKSFYKTVESKERTLKQEEMLSKKADIVFATAPGLVEKLKKFNPKVYFTPNVGDYQKFKDSKKYRFSLPDDMKNIPHPIIGFTGALDEYKFDFGLMKKLVLNNSTYSFVLIGQVALKDRDFDIKENNVFTLNNVHFLGVKPYEIMQSYYAGFDAYIIPYVLNDYTVGGCFPVKFHEALAAGLPTVVTDLPAYYPFKDVCYISKSHEEFLSNLKKSLEEDSSIKVRERQAVAKENDWDGKVEKMLQIISA